MSNGAAAGGPGRAEPWDTLIVGAGPVGLMLAAELGLAGLRVKVVEQRTEVDPTFKAFGLQPPTVEALHRRGLLPALHPAQQRGLRLLGAYLSRGRQAWAAVAESTKIAGHFAGLPVLRKDVRPASANGVGSVRGVLPVSQQDLEEVLASRVEQLGVPVCRGVEVVGLDPDDSGITVHTRTGPTQRARWVVGADGGRSLVRKVTGFAFPGTDPTITGRQAIVELDGPDALRPGWNRTPTGTYVYTPAVGRVLAVETDGPPVDRSSPVTRAEMQACLRRVSQTDVSVRTLRTATRFSDHARQAHPYRIGRVLLAGDAAHVHSPLSGIGLDLGIGDAMNLGWKLAATVEGWAPDGLLDTYATERQPVAAAVLDWTRAQTALMRNDPLTDSLRSVIDDLINTTDGAAYVLGRQRGLMQTYDLGRDHPCVGTIAPDTPLDDHRRLAEHLHRGRALLVGPAVSTLAEPEWAPRLDVVECATGPLMLIRPDGYVAWACDDPDRPDGLNHALRTWFGIGPPGPGATAQRGAGV